LNLSGLTVGFGYGFDPAFPAGFGFNPIDFNASGSTQVITITIDDTVTAGNYIFDLFIYNIGEVTNIPFELQQMVCFKEDTKILTINGNIPIQNLNKGDLVRFADNTSSPPVLRQGLEYEIIDVYPPIAITGVLSFKIDRPILDVCTSSAATGSIPIYVFSRKLPDETNIVIQHEKKPGRTSAGVAKNSNIAVDVDQKIANLVSELKNKIFSTVLTP
jgi:hypothetical protein